MPIKPTTSLITLSVIAIIASVASCGMPSSRHAMGKETNDSIIPTAEDATAEDNMDSVETALPDSILSIAMVGDIMMGTTFPEERLPQKEGRDLFRDCKNIISEADLAVGNMEGTLCDSGECRKTPGPYCYAFRTPTSYVSRLKEAGFDFLSTANNHIMDFDEEGLATTVSTLRGANIACAGAVGHGKYAIVKRNGITYGLCAFGVNYYTYRLTRPREAMAILRELRPLCDIMIVSMHTGAEGAAYCHLTGEEEEFQGENRGNPIEFAHMCIDNGADVVYGHGPHVPRAVELYRDRFIAYSLGNFCTPFGISIKSPSDRAPCITIDIDCKGHFISGHIHSFLQTYGIGPRSDAANTAALMIKNLSEDDMPNNKLRISPSGNMTRK